MNQKYCLTHRIDVDTDVLVDEVTVKFPGAACRVPSHHPCRPLLSLSLSLLRLVHTQVTPITDRVRHRGPRDGTERDAHSHAHVIRAGARGYAGRRGERADVCVSPNAQRSRPINRLRVAPRCSRRPLPSSFSRQRRSAVREAIVAVARARSYWRPRVREPRRAASRRIARFRRCAANNARHDARDGARLMIRPSAW